MITGYLRPTRVLINRTAIYHNVKREVEQVKKQDTELFAVVKADGYGHGMVAVAEIAEAAGASGFCVALLDEALKLRQANFIEPILVMGIISPEHVLIAAMNGISVTVGSVSWLEKAYDIMAESGQTYRLNVHLGVDSGMGRIGFRDGNELKAAYQLMQDQPTYFNFEGIFTHFATADDPDTQYFEEQAHRFETLMAYLPEKPRYVHVSNSATSLWHRSCNGNMIRYGVGIYGLNPSGTAIKELPYALEPAMSIESELVFVKQVEAGSAIGYGATYHAKTDEWIGTVPIGYADGWLRRMQGFHCLVDGQYCEIVGRVCMDQLMIRLPQHYSEGTTVTLIGTNHGKTITLQEAADYADTIHYELACDLAERLPRVYQGELED